jgi:hypothetical protein
VKLPFPTDPVTLEKELGAMRLGFPAISH